VSVDLRAESEGTWSCTVAQIPTADCLLGSHLDVPTDSTGGRGGWLEFAGWVVGRVADAVEIQVHGPGGLLRRSPIDLPRPDVADLLPESAASRRAGFRISVGLLGLPSHVDLEMVAVLADGATAPVASVTVDRVGAVAGRPTALDPILVTSLGRMGTTWLMRLLSCHPEVVVHDHYPHELGVARYWAHLARVATEPADPVDSAHPDRFASNRGFVGHNPFFGEFLASAPGLNEWLGVRFPELLGSSLRQATDEFYDLVATSQRKEGVRAFAEKCLPDQLPDTFRSFWPKTKELILVRDIRDVLCSMLSFNAKRGTSSFGREYTADDHAFVVQLAADLSRLLASWERRSDDALLVRYEELVLDPVSTMIAVFAHLGLDDSPAVVAGVVDEASRPAAELEAHRTSSDPAASIGRWRHDLAGGDRALMELCDEQFRPLLERLGYATTGAGARAADLGRSLESVLRAQ
jgi:hypothetical protein